MHLDAMNDSELVRQAWLVGKQLVLRLHVRSTLIKLGWGITNSNYMSPPAEVLNLSM